MRYRLVTAGLLIASSMAQDAPTSEELEIRARSLAVGWATGIAGRFATSPNTVVSAYSLTRMGTLTCAYDTNAASSMFRQAASRMGSIPSQIFFDEQTPRLPIASFTRLWQFTMGAAKQCDPSLPGVLDTESFTRRKQDERQYATSSIISQALNRYEEDPDRAAQLVDLVLEAGDPAAINFSLVQSFLAKLRERSPELADDGFRHALETVVNAPSPGTGDLSELGKYLFTDAGQRQIGNSTVYDFRRIRVGTNPDAISAYISAFQLMVDRALTPQPSNPMATIRFDATVAYSLAIQLAKHARDLELDSADALTRLFPRIYTNTAAQVEAAIGSLVPDLESDAGADRNRRVRELIADIRSSKFDDARRGLNGIGDLATTRQLSPLIDFAEAKNPNLIQPGGVKRALVYTGAVRKSGEEGLVALATRDAQSLPAEFRAAMLSALAVALLEANKPERAYSILRDVVTALNDARTSPRRARFDPRQVRGAEGNAAGSGTGTDVSAIPFAENHFFQVIDTGTARFNYELSIPGVSTFTLAGALKRADALDPRRLESLIQNLRDEKRQADAYLAIAELRFKKVTPTQTR